MLISHTVRDDIPHKRYEGLENWPYFITIKSSHINKLILEGRMNKKSRFRQVPSILFPRANKYYAYYLTNKTRHVPLLWSLVQISNFKIQNTGPEIFIYKCYESGLLNFLKVVLKLIYVKGLDMSSSTNDTRSKCLTSTSASNSSFTPLCRCDDLAITFFS